LKDHYPQRSWQKNSERAGRKLYDNLSKYFTNNVDNFNMTIQNMDTKKLTHFRINESRDQDTGEEVDYDIVELTESLPEKMEKELLAKVKAEEESAKQAGGRKHHRHHRKDKDDSPSSSTDSSTESSYYYKRPTYYYPINRFVYYNLPYYKINGLSTWDINRLFFPCFSWPLSPSVEVRLDIFP